MLVKVEKACRTENLGQGSGDRELGAGDWDREVAGRELGAATWGQGTWDRELGTETGGRELELATEN